MARKSVENQAFGRAVREVRVERGLSQEALAARVGLARGTVGAIERGEVNVLYTVILKLAAGLDMTAVELLTRAGL
jgi:XRE family transcriptional regulator, regulator of sulfur utilization